MAKQTKDLETSDVTQNPHDIVKVLASNLKAARLRAGLTQKQLGERANVQQSYIFELEFGSTSITIRTLEKMAAALELEIHDLLPDPKNRPSNSADLLQMIEELDELGKVAVRQLSEMNELLSLEEDRHAKEKERIKAQISLFEGLKGISQVRHSLRRFFVPGEDTK